MEIFDFDSFCVLEHKFGDIKIKTEISKHVPVCVSFSFNLIEQLIFLRNSNPEDLVESFNDALDGLATQSKAQMKLMSLQIETRVKSKPNQFFSALNQRQCHKEPVLEIEPGCI